jgi:hypothetical protein
VKHLDLTSILDIERAGELTVHCGRAEHDARFTGD